MKFLPLKIVERLQKLRWTFCYDTHRWTKYGDDGTFLAAQGSDEWWADYEGAGGAPRISPPEHHKVGAEAAS